MTESLFELFREACKVNIGPGDNVEIAGVQEMTYGLAAVFTKGYQEGYRDGQRPRFRVVLEVEPLKNHEGFAQLFCKVFEDDHLLRCDSIASGPAWALQEYAEGRSSREELSERILGKK